MFTKIACTWECKTSFQIKIVQACLDYEIKKYISGEMGVLVFSYLTKKNHDVNLQFNKAYLVSHFVEHE